MKKVISLLLVLVLCLSLCACGSGNDTPEATQASTAEATEAPTKPEPIELVIGKTISFLAFDITITGFDFTEMATSPDTDDPSFQPRDGYVTANLYYNVKYTGKAACSSSYLSPLYIDYNDGYMFNLERFYYYVSGIDAWINIGDVDPLTPEFPCKACFYVPLEVSENTDAPLFVKFKIGDNEAIYSVR